MKSETNSRRFAALVCPLPYIFSSTPQIACKPELFWLDALGALQDVPFGAHGLASRFALSLLDNGYREGMLLDEARDLMQACFRQLEQRYLVSSVGFSMKVVDRHGCRDVNYKPQADKIETSQN